MVDVEQALAADAMSTLTSLLEHPSDKIKTLAALTIFHLRFKFISKQALNQYLLTCLILVFRLKVKNALLKLVQLTD